MKRLLYIVLLAGVFLLSVRCTPEPKHLNGYSQDYRENFEALWRILDEGYCFFDEKLPEDGSKLTWDDLYDLYLTRVEQVKDEDQFFDLMKQLLGELEDGHVNLKTPFDVSGWDIRFGGRHCLDSSIRNQYLKGARLAGSIYYTTIHYNDHEKDHIGYLVIPSFSSAISLEHLSAIFKRLRDCQGLIIDIRNNGGGLLNNAELLTSVFITESKTVGYISAKTGPGHRDFGPLRAIKITPAPISWQRPVVLLTDRGTYSAANSMTSYLKAATGVCIIGDRTGGGGGIPRSSELPNGWWLRFSSSRMYNLDHSVIEFGVEPHYVQEQTIEATAQQQDALIERGIIWIKEQVSET